ncbi:hypothetical protein DFP72DRAFT_1075685 [Ephemerocybe angulata]|uniref:Uncharacterized protein n=1 Tax=Ephemerocybe angulata TaxID=980116 RepID=A0A8H6HIJ1_9AGAR|nr:hypothetical protein DFP72DRAFT_1075685 [Tulosesus angulatus]
MVLPEFALTKRTFTGFFGDGLERLRRIAKHQAVTAFSNEEGDTSAPASTTGHTPPTTRRPSSESRSCSTLCDVALPLLPSLDFYRGPRIRRHWQCPQSTPTVLKDQHRQVNTRERLAAATTRSTTANANANTSTPSTLHVEQPRHDEYSLAWSSRRRPSSWGGVLGLSDGQAPCVSRRLRRMERWDLAWMVRVCGRSLGVEKAMSMVLSLAPCLERLCCKRESERACDCPAANGVVGFAAWSACSERALVVVSRVRRTAGDKHPAQPPISAVFELVIRAVNGGPLPVVVLTGLQVHEGC